MDSNVLSPCSCSAAISSGSTGWENELGSCVATVRTWYHGCMTDFPIGELLDDRICLIWLERHLYADGFKCPRCGCTERRLFRGQGPFPASRCRACDGYYTLLTGTVFAKTRQRPATLVLLRGIAKYSSSRLSMQF